MIDFQPILPQPNLITKPECPICGAAMWLFGVEGAQPGNELLSFDCSECQHIETKMRKSNAPNFL